MPGDIVSRVRIWVDHWADHTGPQLTLGKTGARSEKEHSQVGTTSGQVRQRPCFLEPAFLTSSQAKNHSLRNKDA